MTNNACRNERAADVELKFRMQAPDYKDETENSLEKWRMFM